MTGTPKNLGVDTFPDPLCHFGAPWRPFWILQAVRRCRRLASAPFAARLVFLQMKPVHIVAVCLCFIIRTKKYDIIRKRCNLLLQLVVILFFQHLFNRYQKYCC